MSGRTGTVALIAAVLVVLAGCDSVQEAGDTVGRVTDKASICVEALRLAGFQPDLSNPAQAAEDARKTSEELARLADQAADTMLQDALTEMSRKVGELNPGNLTPSEVTSWAAEKVTIVDTLTRACA